MEEVGVGLVAVVEEVGVGFGGRGGALLNFHYSMIQ